MMQNTQHNNTTKEYFGSLDILRFLAFLCVFVSHIFVFSAFEFSSPFMRSVTTYLFTQGNLGVTFFFVLSGFLITYLLFKEKSGHSKISIPRFYMRRILRIWPVYFAVVIAGFFLIPGALHSIGLFVAGSSGFSPTNISAFLSGTELYRLPWFIFFVANFDMVRHSTSAFFLAVLWSVSVEEQFYLVWPWVMQKLSIRNLLKFFTILLLVSFVYRYIHAEDFNTLRYSTFSFVSDLVTGAFTAYLILYIPAIRPWIARRSKKFGTALLCVTPLLFLLNKWIELGSFETHTVSAHMWYALMPQVLSLFFAGVILYCCFNTTVFFPQWLRTRLEHLGRISYGLYCYHCFGILIVKFIFLAGALAVYTNTLGGFVFGGVLAFVLTVLIAEVSYRYMERPILRLKKRFEV